MTFIELHDFHPRVRCECCGYRTRPIPQFTDGTVVIAEASSSCGLCDWENASIDENGNSVPGSESDEERNDGYSIAEATANFTRHLSMYDPARLAPWMLGPTSAEERELKRELKAAHEEVDRDPDNLLKWDRVVSLETALDETIRSRIEAAQDDSDAGRS